MQADFRSEDLRFATRARRRPAGRSSKTADGGFFFTSHDHEPLIHRPKPGPDNATPSGQRRRCAGASASGASGGRTSLPGSCRTHAASVFAADAAAPQRASRPCAAALAEYRSPPTTVVMRGRARQHGDRGKMRLRSTMPRHAGAADRRRTMQGCPPTLDKPLRSGCQRLGMPGR